MKKLGKIYNAELYYLKVGRSLPRWSGTYPTVILEGFDDFSEAEIIHMYRQGVRNFTVTGSESSRTEDIVMDNIIANQVYGKVAKDDFYTTPYMSFVEGLQMTVSSMKHNPEEAPILIVTKHMSEDTIRSILKEEGGIK
ncbi:MAG: hypothetical protein ACE5DX_02950 [Candidatus Dojkabacteria bacterium]